MQKTCTSLETDNHASTSALSFFYMPDAVPGAQPTVWVECVVMAFLLVAGQDRVNASDAVSRVIRVTATDLSSDPSASQSPGLMGGTLS